MALPCGIGPYWPRRAHTIAIGNNMSTPALPLDGLSRIVGGRGDGEPGSRGGGVVVILERFCRCRDILNINWHRILRANPPRHSQRTPQHRHALRVSPRPTMQPVQLPATPRMQPLVPVHRATLPHLMTIRSQPAVHTGNHPSGTIPHPAAFRTAAEKSPHCGRQPQNQSTGSRPPPLPSPSTPTHPAACHAAAEAPATPAVRFAPRRRIRDSAAGPPFNPTG